MRLQAKMTSRGDRSHRDRSNSSDSPPRRKRGSRDRSRSNSRSRDRRDDSRDSRDRGSSRRDDRESRESRDSRRLVRSRSRDRRERSSERRHGNDRRPASPSPARRPPSPPSPPSSSPSPPRRRPTSPARSTASGGGGLPRSFLDKASAASSRPQPQYDWGKASDQPPAEEEKKSPEFKPNFGLSGALAKDERTGNTVKGVVLKFTEPAEAALPDKQWRLYVYKGEELVETLYIHRRTAFLMGRDERIADIPLKHPSCSQQHAVIQFREITSTHRTTEGDKEVVTEVRPYVMDLNSTHGTQLNDQRIEAARYYELRPGDLIKFATSTREYVVLHDKIKG